MSQGEILSSDPCSNDGKNRNIQMLNRFLSAFHNDDENVMITGSTVLRNTEQNNIHILIMLECIPPRNCDIT